MEGTSAARALPRSGALGGRWRALGPTGGALGALVVLVVVNALFTPNFASVGNFWNVLFQLSVTLLVAVGMTLVIATGGIDLAVGSVMAVSAAVAAVTLDRGLVVAVPAALLVASAVGLLNGVLRSAKMARATTIAASSTCVGTGPR